MLESTEQAVKLIGNKHIFDLRISISCYPSPSVMLRIPSFLVKGWLKVKPPHTIGRNTTFYVRANILLTMDPNQNLSKGSYKPNDTDVTPKPNWLQPNYKYILSFLQDIGCLRDVRGYILYFAKTFDYLKQLDQGVINIIFRLLLVGISKSSSCSTLPLLEIRINLLITVLGSDSFVIITILLYFQR